MFYYNHKIKSSVSSLQHSAVFAQMLALRAADPIVLPKRRRGREVEFWNSDISQLYRWFKYYVV